MAFWELAFSMNWVTVEKLRLAVKTTTNPFGEISPKEFKQITNQDF
ncbi:XkdX family protein [Brevibacillus formosus]|nr:MULTISPECIES: XkdX family protein [Brevibacillus]MBG9942606.1 polysulfide reductase [Brevibacillus formosus]MCC8438395.1 XkdX family protein [Brevibacillus sp. M2.1A]